MATTGDGTVVGFATVLLVDGVYELEDLFTDPDWMHRGIATVFIEDTVARACYDGIPRIEVTGNRQRRGFYESAGFVADGETATKFGTGRAYASRCTGAVTR